MNYFLAYDRETIVCKVIECARSLGTVTPTPRFGEELEPLAMASAPSVQAASAGETGDAALAQRGGGHLGRSASLLATRPMDAARGDTVLSWHR